MMDTVTCDTIFIVQIIIRRLCEIITSLIDEEDEDSFLYCYEGIVGRACELVWLAQKLTEDHFLSRNDSAHVAPQFEVFYAKLQDPKNFKVTADISSPVVLNRFAEVTKPLVASLEQAIPIVKMEVTPQNSEQ